MPAASSAESGWPHDLAAALRRRGVAVPTSSVLDFVEAAAVVGVEQRAPLYWAARATLTTGRHHAAALEAAFAEVIDGSVDRDGVALLDPVEVLVPDGADDDLADGRRPAGDAVAASWQERLRTGDPEALASVEDFDSRAADALAERLRSHPELRRSSRRRRSHRDRDEIDLRRTLASAVAEGGETFRRRTQAPSGRPRRVVVILDVSGSMRPFVGVGLRFGCAVVRGLGPALVEVVAIGTRATRLTRLLEIGSPDHAIARAAAIIEDMGGGTRLADGIAWWLGHGGAAGMARGAVVLVHSDGWDAADPSVLGHSLDRLGRLANRVVWANPLAATPGFAPTTRALVAARPYLAAHGPGHSVETIAQVLFGPSRPSAASRL